MSIKRVSFLALVLCLALVSRSHGAMSGNVTCKVLAGHADFGYYPTHEYSPDKWHLLEGNELCGSGNRQSPIDLVIEDDGEIDDGNYEVHGEDGDGDVDYSDNFGENCIISKKPKITMKRSKLRFAEDHDNFKFECVKECGHIRLNGKKYEFKQLHFHHLSEHTINGKHFPMEAHFVHIAEDESVAVLASFIETRAGTHKGFGKLMTAAQRAGSTHVNMGSLYDMSGHLYTTMGSFTTPPCTEGVQWLISTGQVHISQEQLELFSCMIGREENNRPVQDLNGRCIQRLM